MLPGQFFVIAHLQQCFPIATIEMLLGVKHSNFCHGTATALLQFLCAGTLRTCNTHVAGG